MSAVPLPPAVREEFLEAADRYDIQAPGLGEEFIGEVEHVAEWIRMQSVRNRELVEALSREVDPGEATAIALAAETGVDLLLIDERRGRKVATRLGQRVIGVLGVLIEAKQRGVLPVVNTAESNSGRELCREAESRRPRK